MPKQLYKITQFHGGLNNNADPRDIADNELSESVDIDVSDLGKITMLGGFSAHHLIGINSKTGFTGTMIEGRGLIAFRSSYIGGEDGGSATITDDQMIAIYDDADQQVWVYSYVDDAGGASGWDDDVASAENGVIDIGSTGSAKPTMYYVDGALRVADGAFGSGNTPKWYGPISRNFLGDGSTGYDDGTYAQGVEIGTWHATNAAPSAVAVKGVSTGEPAGVVVPDTGSPISIHLAPIEVKFQNLYSGATINSDTDTISLEVDFSATNSSITASTTSTGTSTTPKFANFCSPGDKIIFDYTIDAENEGTVFTVVSVTDNATDPNVIVVEETVTLSGAGALNDNVQIQNLSKCNWFDSEKQSWNIAVSTLYDDSRQESPLDIVATDLGPGDFQKNAGSTSQGSGMSAIQIVANVWAGNYNTESTGLPFVHPRVSGFNIYMRRTDGTTPGDWYLQATIDISNGIKAVGSSDYIMWADQDSGDFGETDCAHCISATINSPSFIITYQDSAGIPAYQNTMGFSGAGTGYLTAVVANRICYAGNVAIHDVHGTLIRNNSAILKSFVNKFDSFSYERRIETSIEDGDEIRALEVYADRLLSFKRNKMELINISQEIEFLEDTFMHKGVEAQAQVCKTDFGIAWANRNGCYLYDGQKVNNLLEKGGRAIIGVAAWRIFWNNGMVGYIPDKRQIMFVDDMGTDGDGDVYIFDLVTQSWTRGAAGTVDDQLKSNFVIDPWGDLMYFDGNANRPRRWIESAEASSVVDIQTKDIDFGQPGQLKNIYKVYLTYRGVGTHVQLHYGVDGLAPALTFNSITSGTDGSSTGSGTAAKSIPYDAGVTDWLKAELKPSATISNVNSFRLKISGDGSNAIAADFEINDITIVFRLKGQR